MDAENQIFLEQQIIDFQHNLHPSQFTKTKPYPLTTY